MNYRGLKVVADRYCPDDRWRPRRLHYRTARFAPLPYHLPRQGPRSREAVFYVIDKLVVCSMKNYARLKDLRL